jgi:predicted enzyme related to lactoylglutathione lyase
VKVLGVDNVFIPVGDLPEAVKFYHGAVGLPVAKRFDQMGMALFQIGGETPGLGVGVTDRPKAGGQKVWFEVPDARAASEELSAIGVLPLAPPFEVQDPWGNVIGFTDYTAKPELGRR